MKKYLPFLLVLVSLFSFVRSFAHGGISPTDLKTEWMVNPLGIDILKPGLSWVLTSSERGQMQLGYQILVASSEANLAADNGDVWNSGQVRSDEQTNIIYKGPSLKSGTRYFWKVKGWDMNNISSDWSSMAFWEMGLLNSTDWQGKWIGTSTEKESPVFRKDFTILKTVKKATAHVYGLGWYEMHLNGSKAGDQIKNYGATTTWEQWAVSSSGGEMETYDHAMYSGADKTFYTRFGGILPLTPGFKTISIKPCIPDSLSFVKSSIKTVKGLITSNWDKSGGVYTHFITIPVNTTAIVQITGTDPGKVYENGVVALKAKGVHYIRTEKSYVVYKVESGSYFFSYGRPYYRLKGENTGGSTAYSNILNCETIKK